MNMNFIQQYVAYIKNNPEGYWFKRKLFGWGWTPATREGWLVTIIFLVGAIWYAVRLEQTSVEVDFVTELLGPLGLWILLLLVICYKTGEPPKWTFGFPKKEKEDTKNENNRGDSTGV